MTHIPVHFAIASQFTPVCLWCNASSLVLPCRAADYVIPRNSLILPDIYHVHHDPDYWSEPHRFHPDRFLDERGQLVHEPRLLMFGTGESAGESYSQLTATQSGSCGSRLVNHF